jgi:hypothetical protein
MFSRFDLLNRRAGVQIPSSLGKQDDVFSICWVDSKSYQVALVNFTQLLGYQRSEEQFFSQRERLSR